MYFVSRLMHCSAGSGFRLKFAYRERSSDQLYCFKAHGEDYATDTGGTLRIIRYNVRVFGLRRSFLRFWASGGFARAERITAIQRITNASYFYHRHRRGISDRRPGYRGTAVAYSGRTPAEGQAVTTGARKSRDAPVGGRSRHGDLPEHQGSQGGSEDAAARNRESRQGKRSAAGVGGDPSLFRLAGAGDLSRRPV